MDTDSFSRQKGTKRTKEMEQKETKGTAKLRRFQALLPWLPSVEGQRPEARRAGASESIA